MQQIVTAIIEQPEKSRGRGSSSQELGQWSESQYIDIFRLYQKSHSAFTERDLEECKFKLREALHVQHV